MHSPATLLQPAIAAEARLIAMFQLELVSPIERVQFDIPLGSVRCRIDGERYPGVKRAVYITGYENPGRGVSCTGAP